MVFGKDRLLFVNQALADIFGYSIEELLSEVTIDDLIDPAEHERSAFIVTIVCTVKMFRIGTNFAAGVRMARRPGLRSLFTWLRGKVNRHTNAASSIVQPAERRRINCGKV